VKLLQKINKYSGLTNSVLFASSAAVMLYIARNLVTGTPQFSFMAWNLVLSLLALGASILFVIYYSANKKYLATLLFVVWLLLLPNTFYMLTDFVHVKESGDINLLFDIVMIGLFAMNGFVHGIMSLFIVHRSLLKRHGRRYVHGLIIVIILASSFAIDMGRYLRWNSWDVIVNPRSLIFDISDTLLNPTNYNRSFLITGVFFVTIGSLYMVFWQLSKLKWSKDGSI